MTTITRHRKWLVIGICAFAILSGIAILVVFSFDRYLKHVTHISTHVFVVDAPPAYLTEELSLAKAREAMILDGCDLSLWKPAVDGSGHYLNAGSQNPTSGSIEFQFLSNAEPDKQRFVHLELKGNHITCDVVRGL